MDIGTDTTGRAPETASMPSWAERGWYLAVEFQQSSSANFERALQIASKHRGFAALIDEGGRCVYRILAGRTELRTLPKLLQIIRNWKDARFYVRGHEVDLEAVEAWLPCYLAGSNDPGRLCIQPLQIARLPRYVGCHYAGISLWMSDWDSWYCRGVLDGSGVYHIRKERLLGRIDSWECLQGHCPFAAPDVMRRVVALLPDSINPRTDRRWRLERHYYLTEMRLAPQSPQAYTDFLNEHLAPLIAQP